MLSRSPRETTPEKKRILYEGHVERDAIYAFHGAGPFYAEFYYVIVMNFLLIINKQT